MHQPQTTLDTACQPLSPHIAQAIAPYNPAQPQYWNALWRSTLEASRASGRGCECWQNWNELAEARNYWKRVSERDQHHSRAADVLAEVQSHWRVLDIGAGPGTMALPLAGKVAHVTAVEPAHGMATVLRENMADAGLQNITVVQKKWDDVDVAQDLQGTYDLVVISFAFGMLDLLDTVQKVLAVASHRVLFYWHAGPQAWDVDAVKLWPLLHGKTFVPIPKANVIFNLLYSMGIYADVQVIPRSFRSSFDTFEEALADYAKRYAVEAGDAHRMELLRGYLQETLLQEEGRYTQKAINTGMRISWNVAPSAG